jgi:hypothetical protein
MKKQGTMTPPKLNSTVTNTNSEVGEISDEDFKK